MIVDQGLFTIEIQRKLGPLRVKKQLRISDEKKL